MTTINSRLKELRLHLKLTQEDFAARLHVKRGTVTNYELGRNIPSNSVLALIYKEFLVSPDWLERGSGEMFSQNASFDLDTFARNHGATELELRIAKAFFSVDQETRAVFLAQFQRFLAGSENEKPQAVPKTPAEMTEDEIHTRALEIERQMLLEKRAAAESSASTPDVKEA